MPVFRGAERSHLSNGYRRRLHGQFRFGCLSFRLHSSGYLLNGITKYSSYQVQQWVAAAGGRLEKTSVLSDNALGMIYLKVCLMLKIPSLL